MRREREKTDVEYRQEYWDITTGPFSYSKSRVAPEFGKYSYMVDEIHGSRRPESPVAHTKVLAVPGKYPEFGYRPWLPPDTGFCSVEAPTNLQISLVPGLIPPVSRKITEEDYPRFLRHAGKEMTQQFDESASLANFLYELKDFKSALQSLRRLVGPHSPRGFSKKVGSLLHERAKQGVGGNFLDIELNWKSFFGDIPKLLGAYDKAMNRLAFLVGHSRFTTHRRRRFMVEPETEGFETVTVFDIHDFMPETPSGFTYLIELVPDHCQVTFNASAMIDNKLELDAINSWWALADTLGLNNSPKIIWNAVKLSWVMDFFVDSSDFLDAFEVEAYKGTLNYLYGNASYKVQRWYNVRVTMSGSTEGSKEEVITGAVLCKDYVRAPTEAVNTGFFSLRPGLTSHQAALLSALVEARSGASSAGYGKLAAYAATFQKNIGGYGRRYWKRVGIKNRRKQVRLN